MSMYTAQTIIKARSYPPHVTYGQIQDETGLSAKALHCLIHFGKGLPPTVAATLCRRASTLPSAHAVNQWARARRPYRRWVKKEKRPQRLTCATAPPESVQS